MTWPLAFLLLVVGVLIPEGTLDSGLSTLVVTFFGLMATAVLPALSLLVGNTLSSSISVKQLNDLYQEVNSLIDRLLVVLGLLVTGSLAVIGHQIGLPQIESSNFIENAPDWIKNLPQRILQGVVFACFVLCIDRIRLVASAFKKVLNARHTLAVSDSRKRLERVAPSTQQIGDAFKTPTDFGKPVDIVKADERESQE